MHGHWDTSLSQADVFAYRVEPGQDAGACV